MADKNIKIHTNSSDNNRLGASEDSETAAAKSAYDSVNIVYDSEKKDLVPYPDGEYIRTPSPEHSGIPARPAVITLRSKKDMEFTSEDEGANVRENQSRKLPPSLRRKAKNGAKII